MRALQKTRGVVLLALGALGVFLTFALMPMLSFGSATPDPWTDHLAPPSRARALGKGAVRLLSEAKTKRLGNLPPDIPVPVEYSEPIRLQVGQEFSAWIYSKHDFAKRWPSITLQEGVDFYLVATPGKEPSFIALRENTEVAIGKSETFRDLVPDTVSRRHLKVTRKEGYHFQLTDLGSTNGSFFVMGTVEQEIAEVNKDLIASLLPRVLHAPFGPVQIETSIPAAMDNLGQIREIASETTRDLSAETTQKINAGIYARVALQIRREGLSSTLKIKLESPPQIPRWLLAGVLTRETNGWINLIVAPQIAFLTQAAEAYLETYKGVLGKSSTQVLRPELIGAWKLRGAALGGNLVDPDSLAVSSDGTLYLRLDHPAGDSVLKWSVHRKLPGQELPAGVLASDRDLYVLSETVDYLAYVQAAMSMYPLLYQAEQVREIIAPARSRSAKEKHIPQRLDQLMRGPVSESLRALFALWDRGYSPAVSEAFLTIVADPTRHDVPRELAAARLLDWRNGKVLDVLHDVLQKEKSGFRFIAALILAKQGKLEVAVLNALAEI